MGPRKNRTYGQTNATFRQYSVWGVQNTSQMAPQRTTTLDFIDSKSHPPQWPPRQPRTAPRGLKAAQRPPLASANAQSSSWPSLPKARALQPIVDVDLLETAYPSSGRTTTGGLMSYSKLRLYSRV